MNEDYIEKQIYEIDKWEKQEPSVLEKGLSIVLSPLGNITSKIIPEPVIEQAIYHACSLGKTLANKNDILEDGKVDSVSELRHKNLQLSDKLADNIGTWAIGIAGVEGAATGAGGAVTMVADIGAVIVLAFRTIHKIALCYGYEVDDDKEREFVLNILSVSGANSLREKKEALIALKINEEVQAKMVEAILMSNLVKKVSKQLGINLSKRKAMQFIPGIGMAIGAAVNISYIKDIAEAAKRTYQKRWLTDNGYENIDTITIDM
ncbi:EcsC family protein [Megamonas hypermegale]|uniref:EcsC family protein n=1 Tax=Megamonas hypermegale TaxID=158847 RepID=UPI0025A3ACD7|nr:EcsC family protein [Megamonas hypermegale]MDM8144242.1 EcsC family protein [Megamonas hypermegale]